MLALHRKTIRVRVPTTKHIPWLLLSMFLCYLSMAMPLSSLAIQVTVGWGMSNFLAGLATGAAFLSTLACRKFCGDISDSRGGKYCFLRGSACYCIGSCICLVAALESLPVPARFIALVLGRIVVGVGEGMCNMGINHWSISLIDLSNIGRTMANIGMSVYMAVGVGGQAGYYLYRYWGFFSLMVVSMLTPVAAFIILSRLPAAKVCPSPLENRVSLATAMSKVWLFGVPALLYSIGFGVLAAFLSKTFLDRGWPYSGWGLTFWGCGFVCMRVAIGHLPDKKGGYPVATCSGAVGVAGLVILSFLSGPELSLAGCFLTGAGASMVLPSLMLENIRANPAHIRGVVMSCYNIYIDLAYAFTGPLTGLLVDRFGHRAAYLFAVLAAVVGLAIIVRSGGGRNSRPHNC